MTLAARSKGTSRRSTLLLLAGLRPGAAWHALRQTFGHGPRAFWYRDVVRPRILQTPPVEDTTDTRCEIHVLTSGQDWLNLIWTLKSFYAVSGRHYALCIHEDGSLNEPALAHLARHFPRARIIRRFHADSAVDGSLRDFPLSLAFRKTNLLAPKIFDFMAFLESERMAVFDCDLLFFDRPATYLARVEDSFYRLNTFNRDVSEAYSVDRKTASSLIGHDLVERLNSGLGLVHRGSLRLEWIEEFLALPGMTDGHFWQIEQTLFALCSSRHGVELLPDEYTLSLKPGLEGRPFRHYVGAIRHLMYSEGMAHLSHRSDLLRVGMGRTSPSP